MKYEKNAMRLREAMNDLSINAAELSSSTGINKASISQYYNGSHKPSNIKAEMIGKKLNVNPLWLMGFDVSKERNNNSELNKKMPEFSPDQLEIIELYSKLNIEQKEIIINLIRSMISETNG